MRLFATTGVAIVGTLVVGCAGDGTAGSASYLSAAQKSMLHLTAVTAEAAPGVAVSKEALDRMALRLRDKIRTEKPGALSEESTPSDASGLRLKMVITRYIGGSAPSKLDRRSVGVIQIDADVLFVDASGRVIARSKVEEHFGSGGDAGLTTNILNVEADFEVAVAQLIR